MAKGGINVKITVKNKLRIFIPVEDLMFVYFGKYDMKFIINLN